MTQSVKEIPKRLAPKIETLRALFAKSNNQCAFPDCTNNLIDEENEFLGQVCHIEAAEEGGQRFNPNMTNEERRSFENLILFCYKHHVKTNNVDKYPTSILKEIKQKHESKFADDYDVSDEILMGIFNDLKLIKVSIDQVIQTTDKIKEDTNEIKEILQAFRLGSNKDNSTGGFIEQINLIANLREGGDQNLVITKLKKIKADHWNELSLIEKRKTLLNIGVCYLDLSKYRNASKYFKDAAQIGEPDEIAMALAAIGFALSGQKYESQKYISKTLALNPSNVNAYIAKIYIQNPQDNSQSILDLIPDELKSVPEISHTLGRFFRRRRDFTNSIYWFQNALDNSDKKIGDFKASLATTILESVTDPFQIQSGQIDNESISKIRYSIGLLSEAWNEFKNNDLAKSKTWVLINRAVAKKYLKDTKGANEDIKVAAQIHDDNLNLKHLALSLMEVGEYSKAEETLNILISRNVNRKGFPLELIKANLLYKSDRFGDAITAVNEVLATNLSKKDRNEALNALINIYGDAGEIETAWEIAVNKINESPEIRTYIYASNICDIRGEHNESIELLTKATKLIKDDTDPFEKLELAKKLFKNREYKLTIKLLEKITDTKVYSELNKLLLRAYYHNGDVKNVLNICDDLWNIYGPIDFVAQMRANVYELILDIPNAIKTCLDYLQIYPDDQIISIHLSILYARTQKFEELKTVINGITVVDNLSLTTQLQLAYLHAKVGQYKESLKIAYEARMMFFNVGEAHLKYFGLITEFKDIVRNVSPQVVGVDTSFKIKIDNNKTISYTIESIERINQPDHLFEKDELALKFIGKCVGDCISISKIGGEQVLEIVEILDKYIFAFQESVELLSTRFIEVEGFRSFKISDTGDIQKDLKMIFDQIDQDRLHEEKLEGFYKQRQITVGCFASIRGQNPIRTWGSIVSNRELGIYSNGLPNEIDAAILKINQNSPIVFDLLTVLALEAIHGLELAEKLSNRKILSQSVLDCINDLIRDFEGLSSEGFTSVGKVGSNYIRYEVTKEQVGNYITRYKNILHWITQNCEVLPCNEALNMNASDKKTLDKLVGRWSIDGILLAKEHSALFWAEEENLRALALNEHSVRGVSIYILLNHLLRKGELSQDIYNSRVVDLICLNYKYLPINSDILFETFEKANRVAEPPFITALLTLNRTYSTENSAIRVGVEFLYKMCRIGVSHETKVNITLAIFSELASGGNPLVVLSKMKLKMDVDFRLLPFDKELILQTIRDYIRQRYLSDFLR